MYCVKCWHKNPDEAECCSKCGNPLPALKVIDLPDYSIDNHRIKRKKWVLPLTLGIIAVITTATIIAVKNPDFFEKLFKNSNESKDTDQISEAVRSIMDNSGIDGDSNGMDEESSARDDRKINQEGDDYKVAFGENVKISNVKYVLKKYKKYDFDYTYKIIEKKDGESRILVKGVTWNYATNGKLLYYIVRGKSHTEDYDVTYDCELYRMDLLTGESERIADGRDLIIECVNSKYMYMGNSMIAEGPKLFALNLDTLEKQYMQDSAGGIQCTDEYVLVGTESGDFSNTPISIYSPDGKNGKKIDDGVGGRIIDDCIYIVQYKYENDKEKYRVLCYDLNGENRRVKMNWTKKEQKKYLFK